MAKNRQEFRNVYGYTVEFVKENDLFGENRFFPESKEEGKSSLEIKVGSNGQLNLLTNKSKAKGKVDTE